jgi:site-specific recombinase XerD
MRRRCFQIAEHAGVDEKVVPHRWRHSWATFAVEHSSDLRGVQEVLGHASLDTTERYTKVSPERLGAVVRWRGDN